MSRTEINLICLVMSLFLMLVAALGLSLRRLHERNLRPLWVVASGIVLWLGLTALVAGKGWMDNLDASPPPAAWVVLPSLILTLVLAFSPVGKRLADGLTWGELIGFQIFRLPVELILYGFFFESKIPERMTFKGSNYDILTAVAALILVPLVVRGILGRRAIWVWNVAGLILLLNILVIAILSVPGGLPRFQIGVANTLPAHWPSIWILFCVFLALLGHLITFRKLLRSRSHSAA